VRRQVDRGAAARLAAAVLVVAALVTGCGAGPGTVGTAAVVGDTVVPSSLVRERVQGALSHADAVERLAARGGVGSADIAREVVTQAVVHELAKRAAAEAGIVVTEADIDAELATLGHDDPQVTLFTPAVLRERLGDELVQRRLAQAQLDRLVVVLDAVELRSAAEAQEAARALVAGGSPAEAVLAAQPDAPLRGTSVRAGEVRPQLAATVFFGLPAGAGGWFPGAPGRWVAFRVVERRLDAAADPAGSVVGLLSPDELAVIGRRLLQPQTVRAGIVVNPRYGVWDPIMMRVRDAADVAGMVLPPAVP